jgi:hypothetical protein
MLPVTIWRAQGVKGVAWSRGVDLRKTVIGPVVNFARNRRKAFKYELVIGAIFRDEAIYLDDWLRFHQGVGVEHFYLYNNFSTDDYLSVLKPWIDSGLVTLFDWPMKAGQMQAYRDCVNKFKNETRWMAFIDIDEFLFSPKVRDIRTVLSDYDDLTGVFVYWVLFGSSGHKERPQKSVLEAYTKRLDEHSANTEKHPKGVTGKARQGKTIFNPRIIRKVDHCCPIPWYGEVLDEKRRLPPRFSNAPKVTWNCLRINHYWSKSIEDLHDKVARGQAKNGNARVLENFLNREKGLNVEDDFTILPLWEEIRKGS